MCVVQIETFWSDVRHPQQAILRKQLLALKSIGLIKRKIIDKKKNN